MGTIKADRIGGLDGTKGQEPIVLSGDTVTLNSGATIESGVTFPTQIMKIGAAVLFNGFSSGTKTINDGEIISTYNVTSVRRTEAGVFRITFTSALTTADYFVLGTCGINNASRTFMVKTKGPTLLDIRIRNYGDENKDDFSSCSVVAFVL